MNRHDMIHRVQFVALYAIMSLFGALPPRVASTLGTLTLTAIAPLFAAQNRRIMRHLTLAFPDKSTAEKEVIRHNMWRHLGMTFAEYPHLGRALDGHSDFRIEVIGSEHLATGADQSVVFMSAHVGNWEILPVVAQLYGVPLHAVYRAPNNPYAAQLLEQYRSAGGRLPAGFPKSRAGMKQIAEALKAGGRVGMLIDQRHSGGEIIEFFGHPAEATPIAAELALKYKARIVAGRVKRLGPCHFQLEVEPPFERGDSTALDITKNLYRRFEAWITDAPEQWLWTHRRWGKKI